MGISLLLAGGFAFIMLVTLLAMLAGIAGDAIQTYRAECGRKARARVYHSLHSH